MKSTLNQIEDIKNNGYSLDFSDVFNHAFENYKKIALYAGLILLVIFILFSFLGSGILISLYGVDHFNQAFFETFRNQDPDQKTVITYIVISICINVFFSPFEAGFLKMADCAEKDETFNFSTIFTYYKAPHFYRIFAAILLINLLSGIISIGFYLIEIPIIDSLLSLTISLFTSLTLPLIIFGNLNATDAIKSSITIVSKQPLVIILLFIVSIIASLVGFIGFCICVVFTIPIIYSVKYAIYSSIFEIDNPDSIDSIGKSDYE
jgi:hypothetical protein